MNYKYIFISSTDWRLFFNLVSMLLFFPILDLSVRKLNPGTNMHFFKSMAS